MSASSQTLLRDITEIVMGQAPSSADCNKEGRGTVFVKAGEFDERRPVVREWTSNPLKLARSGDILVCVVGATAGKVNEAIDCAIGRSVAAVRPAVSKLASHYLYHFLLTQVPRLRAKSQGLAQGVITREMLQEIAIPLPLLAEQRRIAEVLDRAEALRAKRRATLAHLETLTQAIFLDLFGDPITNPKGWPRRPIGEIARVITGNTPPRAKPGYYGTAIEWIKSDNINTPHYYLTKANEGLSQSGKGVARTVPAGSILVTCIAGSPDCIGNAAMTDREVAFNQQINALIPLDGDAHFLFAQIIVGKRLIQAASTAGMKGMVSKSRLERVSLTFPALKLQREFARRGLAVEKLKTAHRASLTEMDALFASLQHRAFRGEL